MRKFLITFATAFFGGFIALGSYQAIQHNARLKGNTDKPVFFQRTSLANPNPVNGPDFVEAAAKTVHSVVHIKTEYQQKSNVYDYFFGDLWGGYGGNGKPYEAAGSGVIISADGYIVTNNHVVQDADAIEVTLNDKRSYPAEIIGLDPTTDIALIKINESNLPFMTFGNSDNVRIGEWVLAVGNPFNLTSTVTAGIISAKARSINILGKEGAIESFIQTDAAVNPGNSGGALVNTNGELIGVNAAIASNTGSYTGYSFAIPANLVKKVVDDLVKFGNVQRGYIGITPVDITSAFARENGLDETRGVYVFAVQEEGSAREAGLEKGDIITSVNNQPVNSVAEMLEIIGQHRPGEKVGVAYLHDGREKTVSLTLRNKAGNTNIVTKEDRNILAELGADLNPVTAEEKRWLKIDHGLKVKNLKDGLLAKAGVRENFIITSIDKSKVQLTEDVEKILANKEGGVIVEGIYPNRMRAYYLMVVKEK